MRSVYPYLLTLPKLTQISRILPFCGTSPYQACEIKTYLTRPRRTLDVQDEFVQLKAAQILTVLLRSFLLSNPSLHFLTLSLAWHLHSCLNTTCKLSSVFFQHPSRDHLQTSVTSQCNVLNLYFHGQTIDKKSGNCQRSSQGKLRPGILFVEVSDQTQFCRNSEP